MLNHVNDALNHLKKYTSNADLLKSIEIELIDAYQTGYKNGNRDGFKQGISNLSDKL